MGISSFLFILSSIVLNVQTHKQISLRFPQEKQKSQKRLGSASLAFVLSICPFSVCTLGALIDTQLFTAALNWSLLLTRISPIFNGYLYAFQNRRIYPHYLKIFGKTVENTPQTDRNRPVGPTGEINTAFQAESF